ncbi:MAG TPA: TetR/AcrR family transcriptional regulator [Telmatospirillum sp.]|nr:TetR/AcrR family transcriptional regulator [Telmatospirillum sp.]
MENTVRSERSRNAAIQAALTIIARDGPGRLTLDAIARESGLSKGGLMHQFRTKEAVLKALLEHQIKYFEKFAQDYLAEMGPGQPEPYLSAQIATSREATTEPTSVAFAVIGALAEEPDLLSVAREIDAKKIERIKAEATDPELAMLRWVAAKGLALTALFGLCPFSGEDRERLFERLIDSRQWAAFTEAEK